VIRGLGIHNSGVEFWRKRMSKSETGVYGVVLPKEIAEKARVVAAIEGKSRSRLMRDLLEDYLKNYKLPDWIEDARHTGS
jgi:metal-responsive CopG/Arc/MetJ family transcriptional regulator